MTEETYLKLMSILSICLIVCGAYVTNTFNRENHCYSVMLPMIFLLSTMLSNLILLTIVFINLLIEYVKDK